MKKILLAIPSVSALDDRQNFIKNVFRGISPKFVPSLGEDDAVVHARLLKALADPTRLRILSLLSRHEGEVCVRDCRKFCLGAADHFASFTHYA